AGAPSRAARARRARARAPPRSRATRSCRSPMPARRETALRSPPARSRRHSAPEPRRRATPASLRRSSFARQLARAFPRRQRVEHVSELTVEHSVGRVQRDRDAVIGAPVLLVVVRADLLRPAAPLHLVAPGRTRRGALPLLLGLEEARAQNAHRLVFVLQL